MTVAELIAALQAHPSDLQVVAPTGLDGAPEYVAGADPVTVIDDGKYVWLERDKMPGTPVQAIFLR